jgi:LCP family protein required for cell wall assembly
VVTYSSALITLDDKYKNVKNVKDAKIGISNDITNYESNILAKEYIKSNKLDKNNEIVEYESSIDLLNALYDKEIDLIFISGNYIDLYSVIDEYSNIKSDVIKADEYSKAYNKDEVENLISNNADDLSNKPFTILLLGVDSEKDGLDKNAAFNGDVIMLITFNPKTLEATMFSIPRDTYVPITCNNNTQKRINTSAYGGINCVINTVKKFTGVDIDYYVKINFKGMVDLVNALKGIEVDVPYSFCEQDSNRMFGKNTIYVEKGLQTLNGEQALAFSRNRKTHDECASKWNKGDRNDFVRNQNQQKVVEAILNKAKTMKNISMVYDVLNAINKNIDTNISTKQILSFYNIFKNVLTSSNNSFINIQKTYLSGYTMRIYESATSRNISDIFFNWKGSIKDISAALKINLDLVEPSMVKTFNFSINDIYEKQIVGNSKYNENKVSLVPNLKEYTISSFKTWASKNSINYDIIEYSTNKHLELTDYTGYAIVNQSIKKDTLLSKISSIKIYVTKLIDDTTKTDDNVTNEEGD